MPKDATSTHVYTPTPCSGLIVNAVLYGCTHVEDSACQLSLNSCAIIYHCIPLPSSPEHALDVCSRARTRSTTNTNTSMTGVSWRAGTDAPTSLPYLRSQVVGSTLLIYGEVCVREVYE